MATWTNQSKNSITFTNLFELGASWIYNQVGMTYNQVSFETKPVKYNSIGITNTFANQVKNTTSFTNQTKN